MARRRHQHASFFVKKLALALKKRRMPKRGEIIFISKNLHMWEICCNFASKICVNSK